MFWVRRDDVFLFFRIFSSNAHALLPVGERLASFTSTSIEDVRRAEGIPGTI